MTGHEAKPKKSVTPDRPASASSFTHPNRAAIERWARRTGATPPASDHIDEDGKSLIDAGGIRHVYLPKDDDNATSNHMVIEGYRKLHYTVKEDTDGYGYHLTIPQDQYMENIRGYEKKALDRVHQRSLKAARKDGDVIEASVEESKVPLAALNPDDFTVDD